MATGLRLVTDRSRDISGQPMLDVHNGEELMLVQSCVSIVLGNRHPESPGTLYISSKQILWFSDIIREKGYAVDFVSVSLHAISRDTEAYHSPCIYAQIETGNEDEEQDDSDSEGNETLNLSKITEMRLVPSDPNQLDLLFATFCECAELNPDPVEEEEPEHNWVFNVDQLGYDGAEDDSEYGLSEDATHSIGANGNQDLPSSMVQLQINDQRFDDAEEMNEDNQNGHN